MKIEDLYIYPVKSTSGVNIQETEINESGLKHDRCFAIANASNVIITARECPILLQIQTITKEDNLELSFQDSSISIPLTTDSSPPISFSLFKTPIKGITTSPKIDLWLSALLKEDCKLIRIAPKQYQERDQKTSFVDASPIHLISTASLNKVNEQLTTPIELTRFRPNIIVSEIPAFEEDLWASISIGSCEFKVISKTERCSLITINPLSGEKNNYQEPLRTMAKKLRTDGKVNFGIYLIPTKLGSIKNTDSIKVLSRKL